MSTPLVAMQYDQDRYINYTGADPDYYPDGGPVSVPSLHTARVSGYDLDTLELASHGSVVVTTNGTERALEVSGLGVADPNVVDTTVLDAGNKALRMKSDIETSIRAPTVEIASDTEYRSTITVDDPATPTFHHLATPGSMTLGTGVLDGSDTVLSGSFLETTADTFQLGHDDARIKSAAGVDSRIRYEATGAHEFFVGSNAADQGDGQGAIEVLPDKVIIRKDVDLVGSINSTATDSTTLHVEDQVIRLAHTDDPALAHKDELLSLSKTGLSIDTVPGSYADDAAYMSEFLATDGSTKLFVDDDAGAIDIDKARGAGIFAKEFAFHLNQGAKVAGDPTVTSRLSEPFWQMTGGALHMSHTVPDGDGKAKTFSLGFRITDEGNMEMIRITKHLVWGDQGATYVPDPAVPDTVNVLAKYLAAA